MSAIKTQRIPKGTPAPDGAIGMTEQFFDPTGHTTDKPTPGGRVEITFYGKDDVIVGSVHGSIG